MNILRVNNLCKEYPGFALHNVSFALAPGKITGFIGRNGAGKSTTLKCLFGLVHPTGGEIAFFDGQYGDAREVRRHVAFVAGGIDYYAHKKLCTITAVTKAFYPTWDDAAYRGYLARFALDESKTPAQLSTGMRMKYALALALSRKAKLLVLDEPTGGLDPVSRDELLDIFNRLAEEGVTIFFSTHITSDLDKCADYIVYIHDGAILAEAPLQQFLAQYKVVSLTQEQRAAAPQGVLIGCKRAKTGYTALVKTQDAPQLSLPAEPADLETIMVHLENGVTE